MKITEIKIGDVLLNKSHAGKEVLIVTEVSHDCSRYGSPFITTEVVKSPIFGKGKEKIFTANVNGFHGITKIA